MSENQEPQKQKEKQPKQLSASRDKKTNRVSMRMYDEDYNMLTYWSDAFGMDKTEFLIQAMYHYVKWRNQDYDLPSAEMQRLNQMIDAVNSLVSSNERLESSVINGFDAMLGIIRGDNYLVEKDDGEL